MLKIPEAPSSIQKGTPLKEVLNEAAIRQLAANLHYVYRSFNRQAFIDDAIKDLQPLSITQRSKHIAQSMYKYLPQKYDVAIEVILASLTEPLKKTDQNGLAPMFYMPHCHYIGKYGIETSQKTGYDYFDLTMKAQYELTQRFTAEFSIRPYIIHQEGRTMKLLYKWVMDSNPHVRRLCSEGTRPRLPWAAKIPSFIQDPKPTLPILEALKNDPDLYVRRSVANHLGDIAKDHLSLVLSICQKWLERASPELKWVIRHALRHPAKKGNSEALVLRKAAK